MVEQFISWLKLLDDENPMPDEIDSLEFVIKKRGVYAYLELNAYEGLPNHNKICFRPLEAQFFHNNEMNNTSDEILNYRIKNIIEEAFFDKDIKLRFNKRKIYLYFNGKLEYLFDN